MKQLMRLLKISETAATMCVVIGRLFLLFLAVGLLVIFFAFPFEQPLPYALGLLLSCSLSAVKVVLMEKSLSRSVDMEAEAGMMQGYASLMAALRYLLTFAVLVPVFLFRAVFGLWGAIVGILSLQAAAYITSVILKKREDAE